MRIRWALAVMTAALFTASYSAAVEVPCPQIVIESGNAPIELSSTEAKLVCGDTQTPAWRNIPLNQAQFFLKNFLGARGYHFPSFRFRGDLLVVTPGELSRIRFITVTSAPEYIDVSRYWEPIGEPMTPKRLNAIEQWLIKELSFRGYPCAVLETVANATTGEVLVDVTANAHWRITNIDEEPIPNVLSGIPRRYDPFSIGDSYNSMLVELSAQRLMVSGIAMSSHFLADCTRPTPGLLVQSILAGEPRVVSFAFGFDTEQYLIAQAGWRNSRLGRTASQLSFSSLASYVRQELAADFNWYYLRHPSRHFLRTSLRLEREFERRFESRNFSLQIAPAWSLDFLKWSANFDIGPAYRNYATVRGEGPSFAKVLSLDANASLLSHDFEYYVASPRSGEQLGLSLSVANKDVASDISASRRSLYFTKLWNLFSYDPPLWVLGLRGEYATTAPQDTDRDDLPATFRHFLGGSTNLRGFGRRSLPATDEGALTRAYLGTELRLNHLLPYRIQPLVFADFGWLGETQQALDPTLFWSPGLGARWESPIGTVRATAGHGLIEGEDAERYQYLSRWQFYFSFGEQF